MEFKSWVDHCFQLQYISIVRGLVLLKMFKVRYRYLNIYYLILYYTYITAFKRQLCEILQNTNFFNT